MDQDELVQSRWTKRTKLAHDISVGSRLYPRNKFITANYSDSGMRILLQSSGIGIQSRLRPLFFLDPLLPSMLVDHFDTHPKSNCRSVAPVQGLGLP